MIRAFCSLTGAGILVTFGCFIADNSLQNNNGDSVRLTDIRNAVLRNSFIFNSNHINDVMGTNPLPPSNGAATAVDNDNIFH